MTLLPGFAEGPQLFPQQAAQLQQQVEMRMWAAADVIARGARVGNAPGVPSVPDGDTVMADADAAPPVPPQASGEEPRQATLAPLDVMHGVLYQIAGRLLMNRASTWARREAADVSSYWGRHIRVAPSRELRSGIRITYWMKDGETAVPWIKPETLFSLLSGADVSTPLSPRGTPACPPPALEIGFDAGGRLRTEHYPPLPALDARGCVVQGSRLELCVNSRTADIEDVLIRAAAANASVQLAALQHRLAESTGVQNYDAAVSVVTHAVLFRTEDTQSLPGDGGGGLGDPCGVAGEDDGYVGDRPTGAVGAERGAGMAPVLEMRLPGGELILAVSRQIPSGRFTLEGGEALEGASLLQEEAKLDRELEIALQAAAVPAGGVGVVAGAEVVNLLQLLFARLAQRHVNHLLAGVARDLSLSQLTLPPLLIQDFVARNPLLPVPPVKGVHLAFLPPPPLAELVAFPIHPEAAEAASTAPASSSNKSKASSAARPPAVNGAAAKASAAKDPRLATFGAGATGLRFYLLADTSGRVPRYSLATATCDVRGVPLHMLSCVPVPPEDVACLDSAQGEVLGLESALRDDAAGPGAPRVSGKRKRADEGDDTAGPAPKKAAREAGHVCDHLGDGARDAAREGGHVCGHMGDAGGDAARQQAAGRQRGELASVVRWCSPHIAWQQLLNQAQALRIPFTEELLWPGPSSGGPLPKQKAPPTPAVPNGLGRGNETPEAGAPSPSPQTLQKKLLLTGFKALKQLSDYYESRRRQGATSEPSEADAGRPPGPPDADGEVELMLDLWQTPKAEQNRGSVNNSKGGVNGGEVRGATGENDAQDGTDVGAPHLQQRWSARIRSPYLAQLPGSCGGCAVLADSACNDEHIRVCAEGLRMEYRLDRGQGVLGAVTDVLRVTRLHVFLTRAATLMHAAAAAAPQNGPTSASPPQVKKGAGGITPGTNGLIKMEGGVGCHPGTHRGQGGALGPGLSRLGCAPAFGGDPGKLNADALPDLVWEVPGSGAVQVVAAGPVRAYLLVVPLLPVPPAAETPTPPQTQPPLHPSRPSPEMVKAELANGISMPKWENIERLSTMDFSAFLGGLGSGLGGALASFGPTIEAVGLLGPRLSSVSNFLVDSPARSPERAPAEPAPDHTPTRMSDVPSLRVCVEWVLRPQLPPALVAAAAARRAGLALALDSGTQTGAGPGRPGEPSVSARENGAATPPVKPPPPPGVKMTCRLRSTPALPSGVLRALEELAEEGEERLFLDALCIVGGPLTLLSQALSSAALAVAGLLPGDASLACLAPPYRFRLRLRRGCLRVLEADIGLHANGVIYLAPRFTRSPILPPEPESAPSSLPSTPFATAPLSSLLNRLAGLPGSKLVATPAFGGPGGADAEPAAVWVRAPALADAVMLLMKEVVAQSA